MILVVLVALSLMGWGAEVRAGHDDGIVWLGHASFKIARQGKVVYIDPWRIAGEPQDADVVLLTHPHFDHLSLEDLDKVAKADTVFVGPADCLTDLAGDRRTVRPGDRLELGEITVEAVPAYNTNKAYHPQDKRWVGFIVALGGTRIYHAGDTDVIPEMRDFHVDVALLPVSGTYVMTAEEAATAAAILDPKLAVPMHYGTIVGSEEDARRFKARCDPIPVKIYTGASARRSVDGSCCSVS